MTLVLGIQYSHNGYSVLDILKQEFLCTGQQEFESEKVVLTLILQ